MVWDLDANVAEINQKLANRVELEVIWHQKIHDLVRVKPGIEISRENIKIDEHNDGNDKEEAQTIRNYEKQVQIRAIN